MPAHFVIIDFFLVFVCLLLKTDGAIGAVVVKPTEHILDDPFETIDDQETDQQTLYLLTGMSLLVAFHHRCELRTFVLTHEYPRPQRESHESLQRDMLTIYYFQFHDVLTFK